MFFNFRDFLFTLEMKCMETKIPDIKKNLYILLLLFQFLTCAKSHSGLFKYKLLLLSKSITLKQIKVFLTLSTHTVFHEKYF